MKFLATVRLRTRAVVEQLGSSLWFLPTVVTIVAAVAAETLGRMELPGEEASTFFFQGGSDAARVILSTITGSMITVTGLTFSLTVVALQVASGQFTPRLLRTFLADRGNQIVLSAFIGTFAYSILLLRQVRDATDATPETVPGIAVSVAIVLTGICVALLVYFIHHLTNQLRVETVMADVAKASLKAVNATHPRDAEPTGGGLPSPPDDALRLTATSSGYLQSIDLEALFSVASAAGVNVRLRPWVGEYLAEQTTVAWAWRLTDEAVEVGPEPVDIERLQQGVHDSIQLGPDRSLTQDVGFGIRQLVDIAIRALSPGINDPTTAVQAIHHLGDILIALGTRPLHHLTRGDDRVIVGVPQADFAAYLDLAHRQIRRYGAGEPAVVRALARCLRDLAETVGVGRVETVALQLVHLEAAVDAAGLLAAEMNEMAASLAAVELVIAGRVDAIDVMVD